MSREDKEEAARIANEITMVYHVLRSAEEREWTMFGVNILEEDLERQNQSVTTVQAVKDRLRRELDISEEDANGDVPAKIDKSDKRAPYFKAKRDLEELKCVRDRWYLRIVQEKAGAGMSKNFGVRIVDKAEPAFRPTRPNRPLGWAMLATGAISGLIGFWLLKES